MTWLSDWLRELILVVLMAAFVEMLLPGKSMERYARLVLSLLILLTMLGPVISLLKGDAAAELGLALEQVNKESRWSLGGQEDNSLEKILQEGQKLASGSREQSLQLVAEEVAGQMREQLTAGTGAAGVNVEVSLAMAQPDGGGEAVPVISGVVVTLPAAPSANSADSSSTAKPADKPIVIAPVEPVEVRIGEGGKADGPGAAEEDASAAGQAADEAQSAQAEQMIKLLEQNWNLGREAIQIIGAGSGAKS